jgi:ATP-binding cassette subfamily B protein/ATP-binding cassette subfamily C protein
VVLLINGIIQNKAMLRKMKLFKSFQIYLNDILMKADFAKIESNDYLELKNRAYKFIYCDGKGFANQLEESFSILGNIIVFLSIIGLISKLNIIFLLGIICLTIINILFDALYKKKNINLNLLRSKYERRSQYFSNVASDFRYGKEIRIFNIKNWILNNYSNELDEMQSIYKGVCNNNIKYSAISSSVFLIQQIAMYLYILNYTFKGYLTIGDFSMYINAITQFINVIRLILKGIVDINQYTIYYNSYEEFLCLSEGTVIEKNEIPDITNGFTFEYSNVSFRYQNQNEYALKNVSVKFNNSEKLAIVGENGSGKSTFIKLLLRLYVPDEGAIFLNGVNINDIDYDYYTSLLAVVFQDFKLFSMSIKDNIILKQKEDRDKRLNSILRDCKLDTKINKLLDNVETFIYKDFSSSGFEPSGGEGQKIAIARALYKDSPIVILDEPTAALDAKAEYEIFLEFNKFYKDKLVIFISHRMAVTKFSDYILAFSKGELVEYGKHKELMKVNGIYANLYNKQVSFYI